MIPVTADQLEKWIAEYEKAGIPEEELQELRDHLAEIRSGTEIQQVNLERRYQEFTKGGRKIVRVSTAPISLDYDDFDGVSFKPIKRASNNIPKSQSTIPFFTKLQNFIDRLSSRR